MINPTYKEMLNATSVIRRFSEFATARGKEIGYENVFDYSLGNPCIPAPRQVNEVIGELLQNMDSLQLHGYTSAAGDMETRTAIARDLNERYGADVNPEQLFLGCGAAPELVAVLHALKGEILAIAPYFPEYKPFVESTGATFQVVPPDVPGFQIKLDAVEAMLTENTAAIIVNSPNNPAGTVYTRETLQALAELLTRKSEQYGHPIYIVSDEPYRELAYGVEVPFIPTIYANTVVCYSYSKSLSLPGERIGYIYVPAEAQDSKALYAAIAGAARAGGHVCAPSLLQKVIARCTHLRPDLQSYDRNRKALYEGLSAMGYEMAKPDGAFYLFIKAPGGDANAFSEHAKTKDLLVVPGDGFGCPGYFRICYCVSPEMIQKSLPVFRELINE